MQCNQTAAQAMTRKLNEHLNRRYKVKENVNVTLLMREHTLTMN